MGSHTGYFKGEKKKKKKEGNGNQSSISSAPIFVMPKLIEKKKKSE